MQLNHTQVTYIQKSFLKLWQGNVYNLVWQVSFKFMHKVLHFVPQKRKQQRHHYSIVKKLRDTSIYKISRPLDI